MYFLCRSLLHRRVLRPVMSPSIGCFSRSYELSEGFSAFKLAFFLLFVALFGLGFYVLYSVPRPPPGCSSVCSRLSVNTKVHRDYI